MSAIPSQHGSAHEDGLLGLALGLDGDLRREDNLQEMVAHCEQCISSGYRTLADLRALSGGDPRAGARLERLLLGGIEAMATRDHTTAYNQLYGTPEDVEGPRPRRWLALGSLAVVVVSAVLIAVTTGKATSQRAEAAEATVELIEAGVPGEPRVRPLTTPVSVAPEHLLRLRMPLPTRAIGSPYLWLGVVTDARGGRPLVLTASLPADAASAVRNGVPWNEELHVPGSDGTTGAIAAVRPGEMAVVLPARLLTRGANRVRVVAATSDPGQGAIAALTAGEEPTLDKGVESIVASRPLEIHVKAPRPPER
ncbi:MAG: hypothetical protein AMXMBFR64_20310 [Myxococcales bacterium]